jgi:hypothetical protein
VAIKYVAEVDNVHEVSLRGEALVDPWKTEFAALGLQLALSNDRVPMMLSATSAKFRGMRFREFSISVLAREDETGTEGWYLALAFNSSRFFAWVERTMFSTPYYFGAIDVTAVDPARVHVSAGNGSIGVSMASSGTGRRPTRSGPESWEGPLFLPTRSKASTAQRKWFYARLSGNADVYAFASGQDKVTIAPAPQWPALGKLASADFQGTEWLLRTSALHAKSHTYERPTSKQLD